MTTKKKKPQAGPEAAPEAAPEVEPLAGVASDAPEPVVEQPKVGKDRLEELLIAHLIKSFESRKGPSARDIATATTLLRTEARERIVAAKGAASAAPPGGSGAPANKQPTPDPAGVPEVQPRGSWSPMNAREDADLFLPFGADGERVER